MRWIMRPMRHYADFSGRSPRREFWPFILLQILAINAGVLVLTLVPNERALDTIVGPSLTVIFLLLIVPNLAVSVRRLHDHDKPGWFLLM